MPRWGRVVVLSIGAVICLFGALAILPALSPAMGAQVADALRAVLGPQPVGNMESVSFRMQDAINQWIAGRNGGKLQIAVNQKSLQFRVDLANAAVTTTGQATRLSQKVIARVVNNAVTASPHIGWQAYGPLVNGEPVMAQTVVKVDAARTYAGIALVRIDLSRLQLHMMPGFLEPSHTAEVQQQFPNLGLMPASDQSRLVAAFNGGFKAINGHYGMMVNGVTLLPLQPGLATLAIYRDGHVQIGAWGQDILPSPDIVAIRQNCPLIIQNGQLNPEVAVDNRLIWGQTVDNHDVTWRTAVGISRDGRYLIYAVGNASTVQTLAQALQEAGAYNAMQLDINRHYAHFVTYQPTGNAQTPLMAVQFLSQMESDPTIYLVAHSRDFFYLTTP
ncbi:MAG: phosphodiester glycosidase family protein [Bacteroidota bacterium]